MASTATEKRRCLHRSISDDLRRRIVAGEFPAGSRLPIRTELERQFEASPTTVQKALDSLKREGFVAARGRSGTLVVDSPPHLNRYALVFSFRPERDVSVPQVVTALAHQAAAQVDAAGRRFTCYYIRDPERDRDEYRRLLGDLESHRVAGLFFSSVPGMFLGTPVLQKPGIPRVAMMSQCTIAGVEAIWVDRRGFFTQAFDALHERGCRRIAVLGPEFIVRGELPDFEDFLATELACRGMESRPYWVQLVEPPFPAGATQVVHLLFSGAPEARPDGLIVTDDNLVPHAAAGLIAAGVVAAGDNGGGSVSVVAHCNYPDVTPSPVPMIRIGFSASAMLDTALAGIDIQRTKPPDRIVHLVPAVRQDRTPTGRQPKSAAVAVGAHRPQQRVPSRPTSNIDRLTAARI